MARRIRAHDWAATPLGPIEQWPAALRNALTVVLDHPFPMVLAWGPELITLHNDAYGPLLGAKPDALGRPFLEVWSEAREQIAPQIARALGGEAARYENAPFVLLREARPEQAFFDYSFSPVRDESGAVAGVLNTAVEMTERTLAERARSETVAALLASEERLSLAIAVGELASWDWNLQTGEVTWNDRHFLMQGYAVGEVTPSYEAWIARVHPDDRGETTRLIEQARDRHETYVHDFRTLRPDGSIRWCSARGKFFYDGASEPQRMVGVIYDITERKLVLDRLAASDARLRLALEAGRMSAFEWRLSDPEPPLNEELRAQMGIAPGAPSNVDERRGRYHPDDAALAISTRQRALGGKERFIDFVFRYLRPDGRLRWLQVRSEVLADAEGAPERLIGVQLDITEERENEERLRLLMQEVDHRARNLLFIVQGMVALTRASDLEAYRAALLGRIDALSRAHQLLSDARWAGTDLARLAAEELRPYGLDDAGGRIRLDGPPVVLSPAQAQSLALCLHELATNAAKYGALSVPSGRLALDWRVASGRLELCWVERGGPAVTAPAQEGFGATLLARSLGGSLGGHVALDWAEAGLTARMSLPVDMVARTAPVWPAPL